MPGKHCTAELDATNNMLVNIFKETVVMVLNDDMNTSVTWKRLISNPKGTEDAKGVRCGGAWLISVPGKHRQEYRTA